MQSLCKALVELNILKFVTCILQVDTARVFLDQLEAGFLTNQKLAWRESEIQDTPTRIYRPLVPRVNKTINWVKIK